MTKIKDITSMLDGVKRSTLDTAYSALINAQSPLQIEELAEEFSTQLSNSSIDQRTIDRTVHAIDHVYAMLKRGGTPKELEALNKAGHTLAAVYNRRFVDYKKKF
jgi:hypothetical protein